MGMSLSLSMIPTLDNKMISIIGINNSETGTVIFGSKIYGIDNSMGVQGLDSFKNILYPIPCSSAIYLSHPDKVANVAFYNVNGILVKQVKDIYLTGVNVENLSEGFYIVRLTDFEGNISSHKIMVAR